MPVAQIRAAAFFEWFKVSRDFLPVCKARGHGPESQSRSSPFCQGILKRGKARCAERKTGLFLALSGFLCAPVTVPDGGVQRLWDDCEISQSQKDRISFFCVQRVGQAGQLLRHFWASDAQDCNC